MTSRGDAEKRIDAIREKHPEPTSTPLPPSTPKHPEDDQDQAALKDDDVYLDEPPTK